MKRLGVLSVTMLLFVSSLSIGDDTSEVASPLLLIVNDTVDSSPLSFEDVREIYSLRRTTWSNGERIMPFVLDVEGVKHQQFCKRFLGVYPYQLQKGWDRMEYTGRARRPSQAANERALVDSVRYTPGAIGYVSSVTDSKGVRVIPVVD